ncbi:hypothetical protein Cgig2_012679 [Carnegiea gigantea]|uniref:Uncharacterized protein n=1 Tax=Carnegiea gigantea TaxID=171969 RepID=A0A9Q1K011_9CARY|nr:hypothetical protein Cgig2_012679 [Carnegiea gigantea]
MSNPRDASRKSWIKMSQLKGAMRTLENVRIVAKQPTDNASAESPKVRRALFQSNSSLNQGVYDICLIKNSNSYFLYSTILVGRSPMLLKGNMEENSSKHPINGSGGMFLVRPNFDKERKERLTYLQKKRITICWMLREIGAGQPVADMNLQKR